MQPARRGRVRRLVRWAVLASVLAPISFVVERQWDGNLGTVVPGRIHRSAQLSGAQVESLARERGVKTVLNLRGPNPDAAWYRDEQAATLAAGATHADLAMSSCEWMSRAQLRALIRFLDTCEYPLLVHCQWGSERTGLVSAFCRLLEPGATLDDARGEFSVHYLFLPIKDGKVMAAHLEQYATWLRGRGQTHDPARFREWVNEGFAPGVPSREQWPYDPYPLLVVTRPPAPAAESAVAASREVAPTR